ncbi:hypothetical protein A3Q37_03111 [Streptomyces sp. PTY087I2]|nr:hypothetical protein A3Q37_03111 [Streptomyces sp. PTY087I2]
MTDISPAANGAVPGAVPAGAAGSARRNGIATAATHHVHSPPPPQTRGGIPHQTDGESNRMSSADSTEAPIYAGLVEEQGDVPAEVRRVAEEVLREADRAIDFGAVRTAAAAR